MIIRVFSVLFFFKVCALGDVSPAASELTEVDRQLLIEKLEKIQESSNKTVKDRQSGALVAFKSAMSSDSAANELFIKCTQKVSFQDEARKENEFREWRRNHKERKDTPAFRRAIRHQIAWLALTVEIAAKPEAQKTAGPRALAALEAILRDHDKLIGNDDILRANALNSVFAKAYSLNVLKIKDWPEAPLNIGDLYEKLIFPAYRNDESLTKLREAWMQRIEYEGNMLLKWNSNREKVAGERRRKDNENDNKKRLPLFETWLQDGRMKLQWDMEMDLYRSGDQRGAAVRMLTYIEKNLKHKLAAGWIESFTNLITEGEEKNQAEPEGSAE